MASQASSLSICPALPALLARNCGCRPAGPATQSARSRHGPAWSGVTSRRAGSQRAASLRPVGWAGGSWVRAGSWAREVH